MDSKSVKYKPLKFYHEQKCSSKSRNRRSWACLLIVGGSLMASLLALLTFHNCTSYKLMVELPFSNLALTVSTGESSSPVNTIKSTVAPSLVDQLRKLVFLNSGVTTSKNEFVWKEISCLYLESQNVTMPYIGWADRNKCNYLYKKNDGNLISPPSGMRSSVPHGGISAGVFEVRADGTFHEWTIFNQHPAGAAKIQIMDDMFMAFRTKNTNNEEDTVSKILQTNPNSGLPGVWSLEYRGSYPVSKLTVSDPELPLDMSVYVYHWYKHSDMNTSATPAVAFTAVLSNPSTTDTYDASFLINLPLGVEAHTQRVYPQMSKLVPLVNGDPRETYDDIKDKLTNNMPTKAFKLSALSEAEMMMECFKNCSASDSCQSWTVDIANGSCRISEEHALLNGHQDDHYSGVKTYWSTDSECLTVNRNTPGVNTHGNMSLCAYSSDKNFTISMGAGDNLTSMWGDFQSSGQIPKMSDGPHVTGMVSGQVTLKPGETKEVTLVLGWYFPDRDFLGIPVGNYYSHLVKDSSNAARLLGGNLQNAVSDASKLHSPFFLSSVPTTFQDMLINSLAHIRSAFWLKDGRWRQWEAHDCVNIDSVHNDGERHIPYIMIFPDSTMNKMRAWAGFQLPNGMIQEQVRCGCQSLPINPITVEFGCGRVMSDVSSMFIVYLLEILQWHPDPATNDFVKELWPNAKRAAQWHLNISAEGGGLPKHLVATYDVLGLSAYPYASYNGAFHLLAMKAAQKLALWINDTEFADKCHEAFVLGQEVMDKLLWNDTHKYYNAYTTTEEEFDKDAFFEATNINLCSYPEYHHEEWGECYEGLPTTPGAIMTDTFYAQVLAYSLGLGTLVKDENKLRSHLKAEREKSDTDKGMVVVTGRFTGPTVPFTDHAIWMMGDANWASLSIHLGEDVNVAVENALQSFDFWRTSLNEIWNVAGILSSGYYTEESVPFITSHYGYYMSSWHIIFALSGQNIDVNAKNISFSPKIKPPFILPVMIPTVWGSLQSQIINHTELHYTLSLEYGKVEVVNLAVGDCHFSNPNHQIIPLSVDNELQWKCSI